MDQTQFHPAKLDKDTQEKLGAFKPSYQDHKEAYELSARIIRDVMTSIETKSGKDYKDFKELMEMGISYKDSILEIVKGKLDVLTDWMGTMDQAQNREEALGLIVRHYLGDNIKHFRREL